jgi:RNA polymerase sigma-70 factor (ECF subfamily)
MDVNFKNKFEEIYSLESDNIFRFCLVRVSSREQALDITQEVFLRLWQTLSSSKEVLNYKAFLFTVARRLIIDWYRKKKSVSLDSLLSGDDDKEYEVVDESTMGSSMSDKAEGRYLMSKINELKDKDRDIIYLRFVEDLSPSEIGEILGISANTASVRINRSLHELRKISGYKENESDLEIKNKKDDPKSELLIE